MTTEKIRTKKSLGQNWLVNPGVVEKILSSADIRPDDKVLEIGPGQGVLTERLAASGATTIAVEKDHRLIVALQEKFAHQSNVRIVEGDALEFRPEEYSLAEGKYKIIANLPYYITSRFLRLMLESWPAPARAILMVQKEVAERIMAEPPDMNLLALSVQLYSKPSIVMRVSRGSFRPIPDVDSAVIEIIPVEMGRGENMKILSWAKKAFAQKRKQLKAVMPASALESAGISPSARPQELSVAKWRELAGRLP